MLLKKNGVITHVFGPYDGINGDSLQSRMSETPRALQHGSISTGDGKFDFRTVDVDIFIDGTNKADYFAKSDAVKRALSIPGQRLYITDSRYINVDGLHKIKTAWKSGFYLVRADLTATLKCYDPFWYDETQGVVSVAIASEAPADAPFGFTVNNPGSADVPVTINIKAADTCSLVSLTNTSDQGRRFIYTDAQFTAGKTLSVSSVAGTVTLEGANSINNLTGLFPRLLPGDNNFEYVGHACEMEFVFPVGWL